MDSDNKSEVAPPQHELQSYTGIVDIDDKQAIVGKEIVNQEPGHGESGKKSGQRERKWTTALFVVISSIPALLVGCTLGFPSAALLDLTELEERPDFILNTVLSDVFGVMGFIGAMFGGPIGGWIADHMGRKISLLLLGLPYFSGYLMMACAHFSSNPEVFKVVLMLGRFLTGLGLGWSLLVSSVYVAEISSSKLRGLFGTFIQVNLSVGLLLIYFLGSFEGFYYFYISTVLIGIVIIFELGALVICETPRWLLAHDHRPRALLALKTLRGSQYDVEKEILKLENDLAQNKRLRITQIVQQFKHREVIRPFIIVLFVMFFQQAGGLNAATSYTAIIFRDAGVSNYRATAVYANGAVGLLFTVISLFVVDLIGRKILLILSGTVMFAATLMLGTHFYITRPSLCDPFNSSLPFPDPQAPCNAYYAPLAITSIVLFYIGFRSGWAPVPYILVGELLPQRVRGVGGGIATIVNWSTAAVVSGIYFDYVKLVQPWSAWWTFACINFVAVLFVIFFVFETKGKKLEEIHDHYVCKGVSNPVSLEMMEVESD